MMEIYLFMINNKMKSSKVKTIIVECKLKDLVDKKEFNIDSEIFDDVYEEAATRFVEQHVIKPEAKIAPILSTYEKKDIKNFDKHYTYNSYYIIINAGFHKKAEIMRSNFLKLANIDLRKESVKSQHGTSNH